MSAAIERKSPAEAGFALRVRLLLQVGLHPGA